MGTPRAGPPGHPPWPAPRPCAAGTGLRAALTPVLRDETGGIGVTATCHPQRAFHTASIVKAGILAALLCIEASQDWGVTAAADPHTRTAVKNGWMPGGPAGLWVINSIGVIRHSGQRLPVVVLSSGQPSPEGGIRQAEAAATVAAAVITTARACASR